MAPFEAHRWQLVLGHTEEFSQLLVRLGRGLIGRQRFDFEQGDLGLFGRACFGRGLSDLVDYLGEGTQHLQVHATALELLSEVVAAESMEMLGEINKIK